MHRCYDLLQHYELASGASILGVLGARPPDFGLEGRWEVAGDRGVADGSWNKIIIIAGLAYFAPERRPMLKKRTIIFARNIAVNSNFLWKKDFFSEWLKKIIFCLENLKFFEHFSGRIGNFFARIQDSQISNQIVTAGWHNEEIKCYVAWFHR